MLDGVRLSYAFRTGVLTGVAGGRLIHAFARTTPEHVSAWAKQQELRTGTATPYDHQFAVPSERGASRQVLRLSQGTDRIVTGQFLTCACDAARREHAVFADDGVGGCFIHDLPPCRCARCIVLLHGLGDLASAVARGGTLTIIG